MRLQQLFVSLSSKGNGNLQNQTCYTWYTKRESSAKFTSTLKRTLEIPHLFRWKYLADNWNHSGNIIHGLCRFMSDLAISFSNGAVKYSWLLHWLLHWNHSTLEHHQTLTSSFLVEGLTEPVVLKRKFPLKEPNDLLFDSIAHYFLEQGVTSQEVKQR